MLAEIYEQPLVVARILEREWEKVRQLGSAIRRRTPRAVVLVARGSSDNAAAYGRYLFEVRNRLLTSLAAPSTLTLYGAGPRLSDAVVVAVSQSGQGEDVVAYLREARNQGALTIAVVNEASSPLATSAELVLECLAGPEVSVPATKTVTAQMTLLALLSAVVSGEEGDNRSLENLPAGIDSALSLHGTASEFGKALAPAAISSVIGRGFAYPVALEVALKLKETSYTHAEPFSAADFLHGPVALVDSDYAALLVDVGGYSTRPVLETASTITSRGGKAFLLRAGELSPIAGEPPALELSVPLAEQHAPIAAVVLGQLLAVELAAARGLDPTHPRGLRKITSTR